MILKQLNATEWQNLASEFEIGHVYLDPRWLQLIERVYPKLPIWRLGIYLGEDQCQYLLPLVGIKPLGTSKYMAISLPFGNYGGVIGIEGRTDLTEDAVGVLIDFFKNNDLSHMEIRNITGGYSDFQTAGEFKRFVVDFPERSEVLWNEIISGNARTSVRKADKHGVEVVWEHVDSLEIFQSIYEKNASFHGTPIHHQKWYMYLADLYKNEVQIVLGKLDGRFIAALLLLHYKEKTILHAAVTDPEFKQMTVTDKLIWASFEECIKSKKSKSFDFGRTRPEKGKLFFKRKWGGKESDFTYSYLLREGEAPPNFLPDNPKLQPAVAAWKMLPMSMKRFLGPVLRQRIPT